MDMVAQVESEEVGRMEIILTRGFREGFWGK
jgi:hypothetical protein